jgi:hypothetical protein
MRRRGRAREWSRLAGTFRDPAERIPFEGGVSVEAVEAAVGVTIAQVGSSDEW